MAIAHIYGTITAEPIAGDITLMADGQLQVTAGALAVNFYGHFSYGYGITGTITGMDVRDSGTGAIYYEVTGLDHDASVYFPTLLYGDFEGAEAYLFSGNDSIFGSGADDYLPGYAGADALIGAAGNDVLDGGADDAADTLSGGPGNDVYLIAGSQDVVVEAPAEGTDFVFTDHGYTLPPNVEHLALVGDVDGNITGNAQANILEGNEGRNVLEGLAGNDSLEGNGGVDTLRGGAGDDEYRIGLLPGAPFVQVQEAPGEGTDKVRSSVDYFLPDNVENLVLEGNEALRGVGNALPNDITGNDWGDTLDGGAGADTLRGGSGNDTFRIDSAADVVLDTGGDDTIETSAQGYALPVAGIETLRLLDAVTSAFGNGEANRIVGNWRGNVLDGLDGNDTLDGGSGNDTLSGGAGDDLYFVDVPGDVVVEGASAGRDTVVAATSFSLPPNVEDLRLDGWMLTGTGNGLGNRITGGFGGDRLDGGPGADTMDGGNGDDTYVVDNAGDVVDDTGTGSAWDRIESSVSFDLGNAAGVELLLLTGTANLSARGNASANQITGNAGNNLLAAVGSDDSLYGAAGNDTLVGTPGRDWLDGGAGIDSMTGGAGDDVYVLDNPADVAVEAAGGGTDEIEVRWSATLPAQFEILTLAYGAGPLDGSGTATGGQRINGNESDNELHGGGGTGDFLVGGGGNDELYDDGTAAFLNGEWGNDVYHVTNGGTAIFDNDGNGIVDAHVDYAMWNGVRELDLIAGTRATGNALANEINGNNGANVLDGRQGDDLLVGGPGNDTLDGDAGRDIAAFEGNRASYTLTRSNGAVIVSGPDGTDRLVGVDVARFAGADVVLNPHVADSWAWMSGTAVAGHELTAGTQPFTDEDGIGTFTYQWFRSTTVTVPNGGGATWESPQVPIAGATGASYLLTPDDAGDNLNVYVRVRYVDGLGNTETLWSSSAGPVAPAGSTTLEGTLHDDRIVGDSRSEWMIGSFGNDTLVSGGGNDTLAGSGDIDTAVLGVPLAQLLGVAQDFTGWHVITTAGDAFIAGIERVQFTDRLFALDTNYDAPVWRAEALLWAWFGAAPDMAALSRLVADADEIPWYAPNPLASLARDLLDDYAPGIGTRAMVQHLWQSVAHIDPSEAQVEAFASQVGAGQTWASDADLLASVALLGLNTQHLAAFTGSIVELDPAYF